MKRRSCLQVSIKFTDRIELEFLHLLCSCIMHARNAKCWTNLSQQHISSSAQTGLGSRSGVWGHFGSGYVVCCTSLWNTVIVYQLFQLSSINGCSTFRNDASIEHVVLFPQLWGKVYYISSHNIWKGRSWTFSNVRKNVNLTPKFRKLEVDTTWWDSKSESIFAKHSIVNVSKYNMMGFIYQDMSVLHLQWIKVKVICGEYYSAQLRITVI